MDKLTKGNTCINVIGQKWEIKIHIFVKKSWKAITHFRSAKYFGSTFWNFGSRYISILYSACYGNRQCRVWVFFWHKVLIAKSCLALWSLNIFLREIYVIPITCSQRRWIGTYFCWRQSTLSLMTYCYYAKVWGHRDRSLFQINLI